MLHPTPEVTEPVQAVKRVAQPQQQQPRPILTAVDSFEWWQLPSKYKRRAIDKAECDFINVSLSIWLLLFGTPRKVFYIKIESVQFGFG